MNAALKAVGHDKLAYALRCLCYYMLNSKLSHILTPVRVAFVF